MSEYFEFSIPTHISEYVGNYAYASTLGLERLRGAMVCELSFQLPYNIENRLHDQDNISYATLFTLGGDETEEFPEGAAVHMGYDTQRREAILRVGSQTLPLPMFLEYVSQLQKADPPAAPLRLRLQLRNIGTQMFPSVYVTVSKTTFLENSPSPNMATFPPGVGRNVSAERDYLFHRIFDKYGPLSLLERHTPSHIGAYHPPGDKPVNSGEITFPMRVYDFLVLSNKGYAPGGEHHCHIPHGVQAAWDWTCPQHGPQQLRYIPRHPTKSDHSTASLQFVPLKEYSGAKSYVT
jgi:hypothetical protein